MFQEIEALETLRLTSEDEVECFLGGFVGDVTCLFGVNDCRGWSNDYFVKDIAQNLLNSPWACESQESSSLAIIFLINHLGQGSRCKACMHASLLHNQSTTTCKRV